MAPHDSLFEQTFSVPEHAADELRCALPAALSARVEWSAGLRLEPGSFVDESLAARHSDLLFSAWIDGREARLYLLFEHQSEPDPWMPLRVAGYIVRIWESIRAAGGGPKLPAVIPVVLHHGERGWTAPLSIGEMLDVDPATRAAIGDHMLDLRIVVDDLWRYPSAAIDTRSR